MAEPAYEVLYKHSQTFPYEIRRYPTRFAAQACFSNDDRNSPFRLLARYIGVFGTPENQKNQAMAMTAPVIMSKEQRQSEAIAMTAPVIMKPEGGTASVKTMGFVLPEEYDSLDKIPQPTNPAVTIHELPPQVGVIHQYTGSMQDDMARNVAKQLSQQLQKDGIQELTEEKALQTYEYWGFNPPFTLPMFRRNEVWIPLEEEQVAILVNGGQGSVDNAN